MKPAGLLLLVPAGLACLAWADEPTGLVSRATKAHVREGLPTFQPKPVDSTETGSPDDPSDPTPPSHDPNLLVLPTLTVKGKRLPPDAADHLMSRRDFKRKMENLYLDEVASVGGLNYLLNCFTIPFLSPSQAERGKALSIRREFTRLTEIQALPTAEATTK